MAWSSADIPCLDSFSTGKLMASWALLKCRLSIFFPSGGIGRQVVEEQISLDESVEKLKLMFLSSEVQVNEVQQKLEELKQKAMYSQEIRATEKYGWSQQHRWPWNDHTEVKLSARASSEVVEAWRDRLMFEKNTGETIHTICTPKYHQLVFFVTMVCTYVWFIVFFFFSMVFDILQGAPEATASRGESSESSSCKKAEPHCW